MLKQKAFNYLTLILATITIFMAISTVQNNYEKIYPFIMLIITVIFYIISKRYNDDIINLKKQDREMLEKIEYTMKNGRVKKVNKSSINEDNK